MSRYYDQIKGFELPSVTTVTGQLDKSDALVQWAANETAKWILENGQDYDDMAECCAIAPKKFREVSQQAMDIGSIVHANIEDYIKRVPFRYGASGHGEYVEWCFEQFLLWIKDYQVEFINSEKQIFNLVLGYAGTLDIKCLITMPKTKKLKKAIIDVKTGGEYREHFYQLRGYFDAEDDADDYFRLCFPKDMTGYKFKNSPNREQDSETWDLLVRLWWATHPLKRKKYEEAKAKYSLEQLIEMQEEANG